MNNYIPPVVKNLLIINILFFAATYFLRNAVDLEYLLSVYYFDSPHFALWQPLSYMFMHANLTHILFNMFALYSFGSVLEQQWGTKRFINFYLITGLGALGLQWCVQAFAVYQVTGNIVIPGDFNNYTPENLQALKEVYGSQMMGASGAVFGLLVAFGMMYPNAELFIMFIPVPLKAKYIMPVYVVLELFLGLAEFKGDPVAHFAHLGGALIGFIMVRIWKRKDRFYDYYE